MNDGLITITASAICTARCRDDSHPRHAVVDVVNVVVFCGLMVVATRVILDIIFVVSGVVMSIVVLVGVVRVVKYAIPPYILIVVAAG